MKGVILKHTTFPNDIQYRRKKKDISQSQFAKMLGVERSELSRIENGHYVPSPQLLEEMAKVLEVRITEIYPLEVQKIILDKR